MKSRAGAVRVGRGHRFHGDARRFVAVAELISSRFPEARYVADVAGGQGLLARILIKRHNIECEVVDPRGWVLKGVPSRPETFIASMASYYDLIVGLHPDEAIREVVDAALVRPAILVPCCNFWDQTRKLGREALITDITAHHTRLGGLVELRELGFKGPYNRALVLTPPAPSLAAGPTDPAARGTGVTSASRRATGATHSDSANFRPVPRSGSLLACEPRSTGLRQASPLGRQLSM
jgi:hypothetical protein